MKSSCCGADMFYTIHSSDNAVLEKICASCGKPCEVKKKKFEIVSFPTKDVRINCREHGVQKVKPAYDPYLKAMTAITCEKCPDVLSPPAPCTCSSFFTIRGKHKADCPATPKKKPSERIHDIVFNRPYSDEYGVLEQLKDEVEAIIRYLDEQAQ